MAVKRAQHRRRRGWSGERSCFWRRERRFTRCSYFDPGWGWSRWTSSRPELGQPTVGQLIGSHQRTLRGGLPELDCQGLSFCFRFADGYFTSAPVTDRGSVRRPLALHRVLRNE